MTNAIDHTSCHPFRFGIVAEATMTKASLIETARAAEATGYSTFSLRDHLIAEPFGDQLAPLVALATVAAHTTTLRMGTMVIDNDFRHPALLAKEAATLDLLSDGRLELGIGAGWLSAEYKAAGLAYDPAGIRIDRLAEALPLLKSLTTGEETTFSGTHYQVKRLRSAPASLQRPHPPLLIGGGRPRMLGLAGQEADIVSILTSAVGSGSLVADPAERTPEAVRQKIARIREGAGDRFDQIELSMIVSPIITNDPGQAALSVAERNGWSGLSAAQILAMPSVVIGSEATIAATLRERRREYGVSYYVVSDSKLHDFAPIVAELAGT